MWDFKFGIMKPILFRAIVATYDKLGKGFKFVKL